MTAASETTPTAGVSAPLPAKKIDIYPLALVPVLILLALPLVANLPTWATLTIAGLAMGMMIFLMASGLTLVFGLMDVLNFGHGAFISVGAFAAAAVLVPLAAWSSSPNLLLNLAAVLAAIIVAMLVTGALGYVFERVLIRPEIGRAHV